MSVSFVNSLQWPGLCSTQCLLCVISYSEASTAVPVSRWEVGAQKGLTLSIHLYLHACPLVQRVLIHPDCPTTGPLHMPFPLPEIPSLVPSNSCFKTKKSPTFSRKPSLIALAPMTILSFEIPGHLPSVHSFNLTNV